MTNLTPTAQQIYGTLYNNDQFLETIKDEFKCSICLCVLKDAQQLVCEHMFCKVCITNYFESSPENSYCPVDQMAATVADVIPAPSLIRNLIARYNVMPFEVSGDGCTARIILEELDKHEEFCRFEPCVGLMNQLPINPNRDVVAIETAALPMTIYVKLANSSKTMVLMAFVTDLVLTLKRRIKQKERIDANGLAITFGSNLLGKRRLFLKFNIRTGAVIWSSRRFNGGFRL